MPNFRGLHFWSRGYCVSTVGYDKGTIREYIKTQEDHDKKEDQLEFDFSIETMNIHAEITRRVSLAVVILRLQLILV